jgi:hypothetical protein
MKKNIIILSVILVASSIAAQANVIADWTFDTTQPTTAGPISPEVGNGSATASGLTSITDTAGNPSSGKSFSGPGWNVGDYWQFEVNASTFQDITLSYDQLSSGTGPGIFKLGYSTDGVNFTYGSDYTITSTTAWKSTVSDLSAIMGLDGTATVYFRVVDDSTTSEAAGTVGASGTSRIDNFIVNGDVLTPTPEPSSIALSAVGGCAGLLALRRKR